MTGREQGKYCCPDSGLWIGMTAEKGRKDLMDHLTVERSDSKGESSIAHQAVTTVSSGHCIVIEEMMAALLMLASRES